MTSPKIQGSQPGLLRQLGFFSATALVISNMVGTGIFAGSAFAPITAINTVITANVARKAEVRVFIFSLLSTLIMKSIMFNHTRNDATVPPTAGFCKGRRLERSSAPIQSTSF